MLFFLQVRQKDTVDSDLVSQVAETVVKKCTIVPEAILGELLDDSEDGVYNYARLLCHFVALVYEFIDAWSEGDGERVLRSWKIFMLHFQHLSCGELSPSKRSWARVATSLYLTG